jgi:L-alanine-DL-glutamate epimerase-like enolase superfamily enzyme
MRITGITSRIISYDVSAIYGDVGPPQEISPEYRHSFDVIHTDEGIDGRSMQFGWMGEGQAIGHALHQAYARFLIGRDPLEHEHLWQDLRRQNRHHYNLTDALLGVIDIALWDIRGRAADLPIARLLGLARTEIPTYATAITVNPTPEQVFEEAQLRVRQGYRGFKIQFWDGLDLDIPRFRAAREAVGPDFPLFQDAAGFYSWTEAVAAGHELDDLNYRWFEEPLPDRQVFQLKRLADEIRTPVLTTETLRLHEMPEVIRIGAADLVRGDVLIKGGITGLRKAAAAAELFGYNLEIHGLGAPLLDAANLHVALSIENCEFSEGHEALYHEGLVGSPLAIDGNGMRHLPDGPGLGVEMDMDWVDDHTVEVIESGEVPRA